MEVHFTPEQESQLAQVASWTGTDAERLVKDAALRLLEEEIRYRESVKRGEEALQRGEHLTHEQVGRRLQRFLRP